MSATHCRSCGIPLGAIASHPNTAQCHPCWWADRIAPAASSTEPGYPHDYGQPCCCADCTGPDGEDCTPDVLTGHCTRCNRAPTWDDRETTATILEGIAERIAHQAEGQTSWLQ